MKTNGLTRVNGNGKDDGALMALPDWMVRIRQAVTGAIKSQDLEAIFAKQVELAKQGDRRAAKFVLDQARAFSEVKGITIVQNNFHGGGEGDGSRPDLPTRARPGTKAKLRRMEERLAMGEPLTRDDDGPDDEEDLT